MIKGKSYLRASTFLAAMSAMLAGSFGGGFASASSTQKRSGSRPKQQPRKDSQLRLQAAEAKRDRRALRNLRIKARGGYGR